MIYKKIFLPILVIGLLVLILIPACEKDDLCTNPNPIPSLVIRFYNKDKKTKTKTVDNLLIVGEGTNKALRPIVTTDSIALPLKMRGTATTYHLIQNAKLDANGNVVSGTTATIKVNYTPEEEFISKACGYGVIYKDIQLSIENAPTWIDRFKIENKTVNNETKAHIYLYH